MSTHFLLLFSLLVPWVGTIALGVALVLVRRERDRLRAAEADRLAQREALRQRIAEREASFQTAGDLPATFAELRDDIAESRRAALAEMLQELGMPYHPDAEYNEPAIRFAIGQRRADMQVQRLERCRQMLLSCMDGYERRMATERTMRGALADRLAEQPWATADATLAAEVERILRMGPDPDGDYARVRRWALDTHGAGWRLCPVGCPHFLLDHRAGGGCISPAVTSGEVLAQTNGGTDQDTCGCKAPGCADEVVVTPAPQLPTTGRRRRR